MEFSQRFREILEQGFQVSRELASKAGEKAQNLGAKVQNLGEQGVLLLEIKQLEGQAQKLAARLGAEVYETLTERGVKTITASSPAVKALLAEISSVRTAIEQREKDLAEKKS